MIGRDGMTVGAKPARIRIRRSHDRFAYRLACTLCEDWIVRVRGLENATQIAAMHLDAQHGGVGEVLTP